MSSRRVAVGRFVEIHHLRDLNVEYRPFLDSEVGFHGCGDNSTWAIVGDVVEAVPLHTYPCFSLLSRHGFWRVGGLLLLFPFSPFSIAIFLRFAPHLKKGQTGDKTNYCT